MKVTGSSGGRHLPRPRAVCARLIDLRNAGRSGRSGEGQLTAVASEAMIVVAPVRTAKIEFLRRAPMDGETVQIARRVHQEILAVVSPVRRFPYFVCRENDLGRFVFAIVNGDAA